MTVIKWFLALMLRLFFKHRTTFYLSKIKSLNIISSDVIAVITIKGRSQKKKTLKIIIKNPDFIFYKIFCNFLWDTF